MTDQAVRWGMIGASGYAEHYFGPAVHEAENAELAAVLSSNRSSADDFVDEFDLERSYTDLEKFLAHDGLEAVWVASPNHMHYRHTVRALESGINVLCEKPFALNENQAHEMVDAAQDAGLLLGLGYHTRHHPLHRELHEQWEDGEFGEPVYVRGRLFVAYGDPPSGWRSERESTGGWSICDAGTHIIDVLNWFHGGEVKDVRGFLSSPRFGRDLDDFSHVEVEYANGGLGVADASTGADAPESLIEIYGTDKYAILEGTFFGRGGKLTVGETNGDPRTREVEPRNLYKLEAERFSRAVRGEDNFSADDYAGLINQRIIDRARGWDV